MLTVLTLGVVQPFRVESMAVPEQSAVLRRPPGARAREEGHLVCYGRVGVRAVLHGAVRLGPHLREASVHRACLLARYSVGV